MISVLPATTAEQQAAFLQTHTVKPGYTCLFHAEEAGKETGWFAARKDADRLTVTQLEVSGCGEDTAFSPDDGYLAELLIRTAASYAINRMIPILQYDETRYRAFLRRFGFTEDENGAFLIDISCLIHQCGGAH